MRIQVQLSGGQQQRVMIAMAIACEPNYWLQMNQPRALDVTIQKQIIDLLESVCGQRHQMSMLFITHDLALVGEIADEVIVMRHGEIRECAPLNKCWNSRKMYTPCFVALSTSTFNPTISFTRPVIFWNAGRKWTIVWSNSLSNSTFKQSIEVCLWRNRLFWM